MREILFRGKSVEDGEWRFGYHLKRPSFSDGYPRSYIYEPPELAHELGRWEAVVPETVGQYTGLTDKNGKKIFEGDGVRIFSRDYYGLDETGTVEFKDGCYVVTYIRGGKINYNGITIFHRIGKVDEWRDMGASGKIKYTYEVVGNIHDNPELLEGGAEDGK